MQKASAATLGPTQAQLGSKINCLGVSVSWCLGVSVCLGAFVS